MIKLKTVVAQMGMSHLQNVEFTDELLIYMRKDGQDAEPFDGSNAVDLKAYQCIGMSCCGGEIVTKSWIARDGKRIWSFFDRETGRPIWILGTEGEYAAFCEADARRYV